MQLGPVLTGAQTLALSAYVRGCPCGNRTVPCLREELLALRNLMGPKHTYSLKVMPLGLPSDSSQESLHRPLAGDAQVSSPVHIAAEPQGSVLNT